MGAAESKQEEQINRNYDDHEEKRTKESSMGSGTALAVGLEQPYLVLHGAYHGIHPEALVKELIIMILQLQMGKELCVIETKVGTNKSLVVATSHLKSPCPDPSDSNSQDHERQRQAKDALVILQHYPNVGFCGDMNWNEKTDVEFPLPDGWMDAWTELRGEEKGYTSDTKSNEMLNVRPCLQMRLDRILCNFEGFRLEDIDIYREETHTRCYLSVEK